MSHIGTGHIASTVRENLPGGQATYSAAGRVGEAAAEEAVVVVGVGGNAMRSSSKCCMVRWSSTASMRRNRVTEEQTSLQAFGNTPSQLQGHWWLNGSGTVVER